MVEAQVYQFIQQQNRPFNTQLVADNLAQYGLKKAPIQKALDSLAEAGKITCKEFGKTKIYIALQSKADQFDREELEAKKAKEAELKVKVKADIEVIKDLKSALKDAQNAMSTEELDGCLVQLWEQVKEQEVKLASLQSQAVLTPLKDRVVVEKAFAHAMNQWAKRKRIFKHIWEAMSENINGKQSDLFEEMGVETDDAADTDYKTLEQLLPKKTRH